MFSSTFCFRALRHIPQNIEICPKKLVKFQKRSQIGEIQTCMEEMCDSKSTVPGVFFLNLLEELPEHSEVLIILNQSNIPEITRVEDLENIPYPRNPILFLMLSDETLLTSQH